MHSHSAIDIHAHYFPEAYLKLIASEGAAFDAGCDFNADGFSLHVGPIRTPYLHHKFSDIDQRVAEMDDIGVDVHALSLTTPMVAWADDALALKLSEAYNDAIGESHAKYPDRLVGLATLPWHKPELAIKELQRAAKIPGMRGVYVSTCIRDKELGDEEFWPVYEVIEDLGLNLFLHPVNVVEPQRLTKYYLTNLLGNPYESGIAAAHLIFSGTLDRFPGMDVCLPHAGGAFPYLVGRLDRGRNMRKELEHMEKSPFEYIRRFHYDTVAHSDDALEYLINIAGADRVMLGSDYCFDMGYERPVEIVTNHPKIDDEARAMILGGNARKLIGME
jgi:aminocarboxymuconate-semialdehyde decarboxylase